MIGRISARRHYDKLLRYNFLKVKYIQNTGKLSVEMKKWLCLVCDLIYDEAEGWPEDGIKPGTRWEDVPDDWTCPYCGVGKEDFEMVEITSSDTPSKKVSPEQETTETQVNQALDPVVIIGAGMAAYNLAKEFRKLDTETPVKIISRDEGKLYYKPNLSCMLSQKKTPDDLIISQDLNVELTPYTEVAAINRQNKQLDLGHDVIKYGKLIFATGAGVIRAPITGDAIDLIHGVNDLLDYRKFRADLVGKSHVTIIGAGLIGCEFANDLLNSGMHVHVIDTFSHCMSNLLPEPAAKALEKELSAMGCQFYFGNKVEAVNKSGERFALTLSNGDQLETDLIISAIGLRPHTDLAHEAGLSCNRGIMVNKYLETSDPDIYALGDCAEVEGHVLMYVEPLLISAKALAKSLTGSRTAVQYGPMPVIVKTPACPVVVATPATGAQGQWVIEADKTNVKALLKSPDGEILAFALTGNYTKEYKTLRESLPDILND